jgi:hypothetical protein
MWLLDGLGLEHHGAEVKEATVVFYDALSPEPSTDINTFIKPLSAACEVDSSGFPL